MITGAIFDLDGTLIDSMPVWDTIGADFLRAHGVTPPDDLMQTLAPLTQPQTARYFQEVCGLTGSESELVDAINAMAAHAYLHTVPLKPGAAALLQALRAAGVPCAIATAQERFLAEGALRRLGIFDQFVAVMTCSDYNEGKESPRVFEEACARLGTAKADTIVFEDSLHAATTAKKAGFRVAVIYDASAAAHTTRLRELADVYFETFAECEVTKL